MLMWWFVKIFFQQGCIKSPCIGHSERDNGWGDAVPCPQKLHSPTGTKKQANNTMWWYMFWRKMKRLLNSCSGSDIRLKNMKLEKTAPRPWRSVWGRPWRHPCGCGFLGCHNGPIAVPHWRSGVSVALVGQCLLFWKYHGPTKGATKNDQAKQYLQCIPQLMWGAPCAALAGLKRCPCVNQ